MVVDLRKLYTNTSISIEEELIIPEEYYKPLDIIRMNPVSITGIISINSMDEIELDLLIEGVFILPCVRTREEVEYPFNITLNDTVVEKPLKNQINLALLDVLWENIVLEVPIKVVKDGIINNTLKGEGWQLEES